MKLDKTGHNARACDNAQIKSNNLLRCTPRISPSLPHSRNALPCNSYSRLAQDLACTAFANDRVAKCGTNVNVRQSQRDCLNRQRRHIK